VVIGSAIEKYVYVIVKPLERVCPFSLRFMHGTEETATSVGELKHPIVRAALEIVGITGGVDIMTLSDVPEGTGLGSSGSFTVGLLNALHAFVGCSPRPEVLAEQGCTLETAYLGYEGGKQDQYFASYGGASRFEFFPNGRVIWQPIHLDTAKKRLLQESLLLVFSGRTRPADSILREQRRLTECRMDDLREMKKLADRLYKHLLGDIILEVFGGILDADWALKRALAPGITDPMIDQLYETGLCAGALGGKVLGAGGGGFLLFCVPPNRRESVRGALRQFPVVDFAIQANGSEVWELP